jgi:hypothetical protein
VSTLTVSALLVTLQVLAATVPDSTAPTLPTAPLALEALLTERLAVLGPLTALTPPDLTLHTWPTRPTPVSTLTVSALLATRQALEAMEQDSMVPAPLTAPPAQASPAATTHTVPLELVSLVATAPHTALLAAETPTQLLDLTTVTC